MSRWVHAFREGEGNSTEITSTLGPRAAALRASCNPSLSGKSFSSRKDYHYDETTAHGESEARALLAADLTKAGVSAAELPELPKSDLRKVMIASEIRKRTAMPLAWIAQQLHMGTPPHVSHACRRKSKLRLSITPFLFMPAAAVRPQ